MVLSLCTPQIERERNSGLSVGGWWWVGQVCSVSLTAAQVGDDGSTAARRHVVSISTELARAVEKCTPVHQHDVSNHLINSVTLNGSSPVASRETRHWWCCTRCWQIAAAASAIASGSTPHQCSSIERYSSCQCIHFTCLDLYASNAPGDVSLAV